MSTHAIAILGILLLHCWGGDGDATDKRDDDVGRHLGSKCDTVCDGMNLLCNKTSKTCYCSREFPIVFETPKRTLCLRTANLGDECLADDACQDGDVNSDCVQKGHNAICACKPSYHEIHDKSLGKLRCVVEPPLVNNDLTTLILIGAGMTLLCLMICLVLQIFARARFGPRAHHYGNAHLPPPPVTLSIDQGDGRAASRNSSQRSSLGGSSRRQSGSLLAPPKGPGEGSRRASNSSIRSTGSNRSHRSYSLKNPATNHHHPSLHHRPSDPESRSQTSQMNLSLNPQPVSGGNSNPPTNNPSPVSQSNQPSPRKAKRSSSAGAI